MATAATMAYAYGQIDPARTELNAVSLKIAGRAARQPLDRPEPDRPARDPHSAPAPSPISKPFRLPLERRRGSPSSGPTYTPASSHFLETVSHSAQASYLFRRLAPRQTLAMANISVYAACTRPAAIVAARRRTATVMATRKYGVLQSICCVSPTCSCWSEKPGFPFLKSAQCRFESDWGAPSKSSRQDAFPGWPVDCFDTSWRLLTA